MSSTTTHMAKDLYLWWRHLAKDTSLCFPSGSLQLWWVLFFWLRSQVLYTYDGQWQADAWIYFRGLRIWPKVFDVRLLASSHPIDIAKIWQINVCFHFPTEDKRHGSGSCVRCHKVRLAFGVHKVFLTDFRLRSQCFLLSRELLLGSSHTSV